MLILSMIAATTWAVYLIVICLPHDLHMLQQNSYRNDRYLRWYQQHHQDELRLGELGLGAAVVTACFVPLGGLVVFALLLLLLSGWRLTHKKAVIKPLVMTKRAIRLYGVTGVIVLLLGVALTWAWVCCSGLAGRILLPLLLLSTMVIIRYSFVLTYSANYLLIPVERGINRHYANQARSKINNLPHLRRIGITGSYGKTSVKKISEAILAEKYLTLATPESYNTPMGITRVIREELRPIHQVFICEMGARQRGDIRELAELTSPQIGVLTAIGPQHLETFCDMQTIVDTKFELIEALPTQGVAVLNLDNPEIARNSHRAPCRVVGYGLGENCDFRAEQIVYDGQGSRFILCHGADRVEFTTRLLGEHNICNILGAVAVAYQLEVPLPMAARAVKRLAPISHRLELKEMPQYTMLDDAYNANPTGAHFALTVLKAMKGGQKIIITPGMVELGDREKELNLEFAAAMTEFADYIILVGQQRGEMMEEALIAKGYPPKCYYIAANLRDARIRLSQIVHKGDIVLYENDLPDLY
ncbi:MAG: UDP-N-acetylmuramoyl-tripeptide--D-alanyl-D-alanine ligase [Clostridiales bacterium]